MMQFWQMSVKSRFYNELYFIHVIIERFHCERLDLGLLYTSVYILAAYITAIRSQCAGTMLYMHCIHTTLPFS